MSRITPTYYPLNSPEEIDKIVEASNTRLIIIDAHQEWCGPCTALQSFFNQIWVDFDDPSKRVMICQVPLVGGSVKKIQDLLGNDIKVALQGCRPLFLLLRGGHTVAIVDGLNAPLIRMHFEMNIPKAAKKDD